MEKLERYIVHYDDVFKPDLCDKIINAYESMATKEIVDDEKDPQYELDTRRFEWANITKNHSMLPEFEMIAQMFMHIFQDYRKLVPYGTYIPNSPMLEDIKVKKYRGADDHFKMHTDSSNKQTMIRTLSAFTYLNDSPGTQFFDDLVIEGKKGRVVVFPPTWQYPHKGLNDARTKYFMGTYLHRAN